MEIEVNGLMTYDRAVVKMPVEKLAAAHKKLFGPPPVVRDLVPTSQKEPQTWQYTTDKPADDWIKPDFDDSELEDGPRRVRHRPARPARSSAPSGRPTTSGFAGRSTLPEKWPTELRLRLHHDEDAEVYINGVLAAKVARLHHATTRRCRCRPAAAAALRPGKNVLAVHCHQTTGGQYIDVGLAALEADEVAVVELGRPTGDRSWRANETNGSAETRRATMS